MARRIVAIACLALTTLLSGCVPNRLYRKQGLSIQEAPIVDGLPAHFKLAMIEFDDMGEAWEKCHSLSEPDSCQLTRALELIRREKRKSSDLVVVVFTHGWKNNASPNNERKKNLHDFKAVMERLAAGEDANVQQLNQASGQGVVPAKRRSYIGVYLGWRGQSLAGDIFTTFWNRRDAAERVGSSDFAETLYRIMQTTKEDSPQSKVILVGHSFGARALETALTNTFVSLLVPRPGTIGPVGPPVPWAPADLIVYVNAATDSFRTKQMIELMKRTQFGVSRGILNTSGPLFLSVTSTGDQATKLAFPLGQNISALEKSFRAKYDFETPEPPNQKTFFTRTPGHIPFLLSHVVRPVAKPCISLPELFRFSTNGQCFEMTPLQGRWNDSPFWVVTVPPAIIKDHGDIFNASFMTMIIDLLAQYQVLNRDKPTIMSRAY